MLLHPRRLNTTWHILHNFFALHLECNEDSHCQDSNKPVFDENKPICDIIWSVCVGKFDLFYANN